MPNLLLKTAYTSAILVVLSLLGTLTLHADPGVFDDRIVFGQSAALKGPAAALGLGMREGILAAFHEANATGGVHGRKLELISYNDDYEPEVAIAKTNKLIEEDKVFALIGEVGTPTSKAVQPIATEQGVPFIAPFTGADFLRDPSADKRDQCPCFLRPRNRGLDQASDNRSWLVAHSHSVPRRFIRPCRPRRCEKGSRKARLGSCGGRHVHAWYDRR